MEAGQLGDTTTEVTVPDLLRIIGMKEVRMTVLESQVANERQARVALEQAMQKVLPRLSAYEEAFGELPEPGKEQGDEKPDVEKPKEPNRAERRAAK